MLEDNKYEKLLGNSFNQFNISVSSVLGSMNNGKYTVYIGSAKNPYYHTVDCGSGKKVNSKPVSFTYTDAAKSKVVISLFNKKSFWGNEQKIGEAEILISDFERDQNIREISFANNGPKVMIHAERLESY